MADVKEYTYVCNCRKRHGHFEFERVRITENKTCPHCGYYALYAAIINNIMQLHGRKKAVIKDNRNKIDEDWITFR